jgi:hypothetical protein
MKVNNYLVTATELNEMATTFGYSTKNGIANSNKIVTKAQASNAFYLDESASPYVTYTSTRCPRYQDIICAPAGLTITASTVSASGGTPITPKYNQTYTYLFKVKSTVPAQNSGYVTFDITLPSNITLGDFRYVYYNGSPVPNPVSNYYNVDIFNASTGQVRITLFKPTTTEYSIAFDAKANQQFGTFSVTGYASGLWCTNTVTASATNSYTLVVPNVNVSKVVTSSSQSSCVTAKLYTITITNSGGSLIGGTFTDTLPTGLILDPFIAIHYDGKQIGPCTGTIFDPCPSNQLPLPTSDYYNVVTWQDNTNGGQMVVEFFKEIGDGHYYTVFVGARNTGATASYTNTANFVNGTYTASGSDTSTYTTYPTTTYYELFGCVASDYAYTTIVPLGINNRYVLPSSGAYYTYTGATVNDCVVPPGYNALLQRTTSYNCTDPTTTTTTTLANINFTLSYNCTSNGINNITISNVTGGSGSYQISNDPKTSEYNAANGSFISLSGSTYTYYNNQNGTWYVAVRDANNNSLLTVKNTGNIYCCPDTSPNWQNNGGYSCYGTCDLYYIQQDYNSCSPTYNQTRQGSVASYNSTSCGGCCGQSTSANWQNTGSYSCYGTCNKYNIEQDINPCSSTYNQTRQGSLNQSNSTFCGGCCGQSTSANWVDNGATFCSGCNLYQPQIDNNSCSATYNQTRNVNLGASSTCGTWNTTYYCVGYDYYSKEVNSCTSAERNVTLVEANSPNCGYVPPPTCRVYNIISGSSSGVTGTYQGCASGSTTSFSFPGGPGVVGTVCARVGTVSVSGGTSFNTGTSCT